MTSAAMPKPNYRTVRDPWMLAEDIPDIDFFFSQIWLSCFVNEFQKPGGRAYRHILAVYRGYHLWFYYREQDSKKVGDHLVQRFVHDPSLVKRVNREIIRHSDRLRRFSERVPEDHLDTLSNATLTRLLIDHDRLHTAYYQWGWIPVAADMFHANLTQRLKSFLFERQVHPDKVNEHLVTLTQPTRKSLIQIEHESLLKIAVRIQRDPYHRKLFAEMFRLFKEREVAKYGFKTHSKEYEQLFEQSVAHLRNHIKPGILRAIQKHYETYFFVNHLWVGEVSSFERYLKELVRLVGMGNPAKQFRDEQKVFLATAARRRKLIATLRIRREERILFDGFGDFMVTKIYRRYAQIYALYKMEFILQEIARRLRLTLKEVRFLLPKELHRALRTGRVNRKELRARTRFCVYDAERGIDRIVTGARARKLVKQTESAVEDVSELSGQTGCVGTATGTVRIIIRPGDMGKMRKGDILVSIATDPDIVPAMKKAAAIVTEQGGVTSHAAIVSREMHIPCVIGTKVATKVLKDGDRVEVDATKGIVRKL
jgi:phosphohistidine swiveling domain-containing protein